MGSMKHCRKTWIFNCGGLWWYGVGVEFHEPPQILHYGNSGVGELLFENMTFTIEPMINMGKCEYKILEDGWTVETLDGSLSAQWEHTLLVTKNVVEILT